MTDQRPPRGAASYLGEEADLASDRFPEGLPRGDQGSQESGETGDDPARAGTPAAEVAKDPPEDHGDKPSTVHDSASIGDIERESPDDELL